MKHRAGRLSGAALAFALVMPTAAVAASHPIGPAVCVGCAPSTPSSGGYRLTQVSARGYQFAVLGIGWGAQRRVTVKLAVGTSSRHLSLLTTSRGKFEVGVRGVNLCQQVTLRIHDAATHQGTVTKAPLTCPVSQEESPGSPVLAVLRGKRLKS